MLKRTTRGLLIGMAVLYCVVVVALGLIWTFGPDGIWWLELSNIFALFLFAPLLLLTPAALLLRSDWLRGATLLTLAAFLALFGSRLVPPFGWPAQGSQLRVMTINQLYTNERIADLIKAIRAQDADIIAIQELSTPLAEAAGQQLSDRYPYQFLSPGPEDYGLGILSRYPLLATERTRGFMGQQMTVDVDGMPITVVNVHLNAPQAQTRRLRQFRPVKVVLDYDTSLRARDFPGLLQEIDTIAGPLIVMGDFNTSDREPPYADLATRLQDAYRETGWGFGFTFPNDKQLARLKVPFPLVRIDYVWSRAGIVPTTARVVCDSGGSDHCAVVADLRIGSDDRPFGGVYPALRQAQEPGSEGLRAGD
jgi:endonuclease/exonuclease/phosphatase (EEP) superfamily protein YafD